MKKKNCMSENHFIVLLVYCVSRVCLVCVVNSNGHAEQGKVATAGVKYRTTVVYKLSVRILANGNRLAKVQKDVCVFFLFFDTTVKFFARDKVES
jgi:hypothetical protein